MEDWQQRVVDEYDQLVDRHVKLGQFIGTPTFQGLDIADQSLLETQWLVMAAYGNVLESRIKRFQK